MEKKRYHMIRKQQADVKALLRVLVSGYLLYLAWKLVGSSVPGFPQEVRYLISGTFAVGAAAFGWFTWKSYRAGLKDAELTPEEKAELDRDERQGQ